METKGRKKKCRIAAVLAVFLTVCFLTAACGSSGTANYTAEDTERYSESGEYSESASAEDYQYDDGGEDAETLFSDEKLVYSASYSIETVEYEKVTASIRKRVRDAGGITEHEEEYDDTDYRYYYGTEDSSENSTSMDRHLSLTVLIPADRYEEFIEGLNTEERIVNHQSSVENITRSYNDKSAEIEAYEKQEERLLEMMDQAGTIEDMISVEKRLTEVQTELNQLRSQLADMDTAVAYSTVSIEIEEVQAYTETVKEQPTFSSRVRVVLERSFRQFAGVLEQLLYVLIYLLPYLIIVAAVLAIVFGVRCFRKKKGGTNHKPKGGAPYPNQPARPAGYDTGRTPAPGSPAGMNGGSPASSKGPASPNGGGSAADRKNT